MSKLPRISGRECIRALEKADFYFKRQEEATLSSDVMILSPNSSCLTTRNSTVVLCVRSFVSPASVSMNSSSSCEDLGSHDTCHSRESRISGTDGRESNTNDTQAFILHAIS